jgi:hypothetical protein
MSRKGAAPFADQPRHPVVPLVPEPEHAKSTLIRTPMLRSYGGGQEAAPALTSMAVKKIPERGSSSRDFDELRRPPW